MVYFSRQIFLKIKIILLISHKKYILKLIIIFAVCGESTEFHDSRNLVNVPNFDNSNESNKDLIQNESSNNNLVQNVNISEEETNICPIYLSKFDNQIELEVCKH